MTTINVPRELLERAAYQLELAELTGPTYRELSAMLAKQPQGGAGQDDECVAFEVVYAQRSGNKAGSFDRAEGEYVSAGIQIKFNYFKAGAAWQRTQPAARHDQGDEVRRLREALEFYANGDHLLLADPDAWDTCSGEPMNWLHDEAGTASVEDGSLAKAALTQSPKGEEE